MNSFVCTFPMLKSMDVSVIVGQVSILRLVDSFVSVLFGFLHSFSLCSLPLSLVNLTHTLNFQRTFYLFSGNRQETITTVDQVSRRYISIQHFHCLQ